MGANKGFSNSEQDSSLHHVSSELQIKTQYGSIYIKFRWRKIRDGDRLKAIIRLFNGNNRIKLIKSKEMITIEVWVVVVTREGGV